MSKHILLVDDYDDAREMLQYVLEKRGYRITEALDGLAAVELVRKELPDLIVMDVSMPEMDGIEATRRIREITPDIPIICLTAYKQAFETHAFDAGFDEVLPKPVDLQKLFEIIEKYLYD